MRESWGVASNTASIVLYLLGIISASKYGASITAFVIVALSVPLFWVGAFIAWKKQHDGRIKAEKRSSPGRPSIAPSSYKQKDQSFGMTIVNSGYAAYDVHIPDVPVGDSGYVLQFAGIFSVMPHRDQAFFETWLENHLGLPGCDGGQLFEVMQQASVQAIEFGILSKDTESPPNCYRDKCSITCDNNAHRTGLVLRHIEQEIIPAPMQSV